MKKHIIIILLSIAVTPLFSQESRDQVFGLVTDAEKQAIPHVNIDYKGNQSEVATYLKVSVYHDYGLSDQQIEINVYTLWENQEKAQLFMFQHS